MDFNVNEVIEDGIKNYSPTEKQIELAHKRLKICQLCENGVKKIDNGITTIICNDCGCSLSKISFFQEFNVCGLHKFINTDKGYFNIKENKTLI